MSDREPLLALIQKYADDVATADEIARLHSLLRVDVRARRLFREYLELDAALERMAAFDGRPAHRASRWPLWQRIVAGTTVAMVIAGLAALSAGWLESHSATPIADNPRLSPSPQGPLDSAFNAASRAATRWTVAPWTVATVAVVTRDLGAQWGPGAGPADDSLVPGTYDLREGTVEVKFRSGAKAVLVGPAQLDVYDASHVSLNTGRARVTVPEGPDETSFRVDTPTSRLADAGTEYGVEVQPTGCSLVQVYEGEVSASAKVESQWQPEQAIGEGRALRFGERMEEVPFWPERFVQLLPGPDAPEGRGSLPYNRSRYRSIAVAAAPAEIAIDGDLSDWDLSHRIRAACEPPYADHYFLEGAVMYDREHLYVGAHVGDPHPMRGQISPLEHVNRHGMGGAVSLRISTDRKAGWPLRAENVVARLGRPAGPQDQSDKLAFVVMWYYAPSQLPCLHLRYGMDMHGLKVNPEGYRGAFRIDPDGRGYTLEYAIPWKLLNAADDPPTAGDELGFMFLTHWSDAEGTKWQGQLIDVTDPDEHGWNFERAATWGKAIYQSPTPQNNQNKGF
jgi:hypothetical protein